MGTEISANHNIVGVIQIEGRRTYPCNEQIGEHLRTDDIVAGKNVHVIVQIFEHARAIFGLEDKDLVVTLRTFVILRQSVDIKRGRGAKEGMFFPSVILGDENVAVLDLDETL